MKLVEQVKSFVIKQPNTLLAVIGFVLGVLIATEYSAQIPRIINPAGSSLALDDMESKLNNEQSALKESLESVDNEITDYQDNLKTRQGGLTNLVDEVEILKSQVGLSELSGQGIEVVLDDSNTEDAQANAIAHASDLRDLIDLLWSRGAQAISIEAQGGVEERIVYSSSIDCVVNTVLINSTKAAPPFKIKALGNRDALLAAVSDRTALKSIYDRIDKDGLKFFTTDNANLTIGKYKGDFVVDHAKAQ